MDILKSFNKYYANKLFLGKSKAKEPSFLRIACIFKTIGNIVS